MEDEDEIDIEGPLLVAAGTLGNRRFGVLLRTLRESSGLTPQELAEQARVHPSFVRGIERGVQAPSVATARPLLAVLEGRHRIRWIEEGAYDLLVRDPDSGGDVAFEFKARVKGQNRRNSVGLAGAKAGLEVLAAATRQLGLGHSEGEPHELQESPATQDDEGRPPRSRTADDSAFGRVVRLLAAADEQTLVWIERLLRDGRESSPKPPRRP